MAANNNLSLQWQPNPFPGEDPNLFTWRKLSTQYIYDLRGQISSLNTSTQSFSNNITQNVTKITDQLAAIANNSNNGNSNAPPVIYNLHSLRLASYPAANYNGYLFVETDRFNAAYYSNSVQWDLIEGAGYGSFENRWTGLGPPDSGMTWFETSRNNINSTAPFPFYRWNGNHWNFINGAFYRTQTQLVILAATFATNNSRGGVDDGAIVYVVDYQHQLQWINANAGFTWGPGDDGRAGEGPIFRELAPTTPGYHLYDGTNNVTYLNANGNYSFINLANLQAGSSNNTYTYPNTFIVAGANASGINPPVFPVLVGNLTANVTNNSTAANFSIPANNAGNNTFAPALTSADFVFSGSNNNSFGVSNNALPPTLVRNAWFRQ